MFLWVCIVERDENCAASKIESKVVMSGVAQIEKVMAVRGYTMTA